MALRYFASPFQYLLMFSFYSLQVFNKTHARAASYPDHNVQAPHKSQSLSPVLNRVTSKTEESRPTCCEGHN